MGNLAAKQRLVYEAFNAQPYLTSKVVTKAKNPSVTKTFTTSKNEDEDSPDWTKMRFSHQLTRYNSNRTLLTVAPIPVQTRVESARELYVYKQPQRGMLTSMSGNNCSLLTSQHT